MISNFADAFPTSSLKVLCLDEADEMLSRGFKDAMYEIFQYMPQDIQMCLFSATMPVEVRELTASFMRDPVEILVKSGQLTLDGIGQYFVDVQEEAYKLDTLCDLYQDISISQAIIFVNSQKKADHLADQLIDRHFTVSVIHGGYSSEERQLRMKEFKAGASRVMISTDLLARGIDCYEVQVVINFDLPREYETYIHRIGRSGRFGRKGVALNFVTQHDEYVIHGLQKFYSTVITELPRDLAEVF